MGASPPPGWTQVPWGWDGGQGELIQLRGRCSRCREGTPLGRGAGCRAPGTPRGRADIPDVCLLELVGGAGLHAADLVHASTPAGTRRSRSWKPSWRRPESRATASLVWERGAATSCTTAFIYLWERRCRLWWSSGALADLLEEMELLWWSSGAFDVLLEEMELWWWSSGALAVLLEEIELWWWSSGALAVLLEETELWWSSGALASLLEEMELWWFSGALAVLLEEMELRWWTSGALAVLLEEMELWWWSSGALPVLMEETELLLVSSC